MLKKIRLVDWWVAPGFGNDVWEDSCWTIQVVKKIGQHFSGCTRLYTLKHRQPNFNLRFLQPAWFSYESFGTQYLCTQLNNTDWMWMSIQNCGKLAQRTPIERSKGCIGSLLFSFVISVFQVPVGLDNIVQQGYAEFPNQSFRRVDGNTNFVFWFRALRTYLGTGLVLNQRELYSWRWSSLTRKLSLIIIVSNYIHDQFHVKHPVNLCACLTREFFSAPCVTPGCNQT